MRFSNDELRALNARFADAPAEALLGFVAETFAARAAVLSSMQRADAALCHIAQHAGLELDVLFVDTGVLHRETLEVRDALAARFDRLRVRTLEPARSFAAQTDDEGVLYLTPEGQLRCCDLRKSAPLRAVAAEYDALASALRRSEGGARAQLTPFGIDSEANALRVHPLHAWSPERLDAYLAAHAEIPVHPLHRWGFPTIGCYPCTTPVRADEPARAGRWRHLAGVEYCGINPVDRGAAGAIELDDRYRDALTADA